jgi:hypothetical protein
MTVIGCYLFVFPILMSVLMPREKVASDKTFSTTGFHPANELVGPGI